MTRNEVLDKIMEARKAIQEYKAGNMGRTFVASEKEQVNAILRESRQLIVEARTIGAAGQTCPRCGGSGRV